MLMLADRLRGLRGTENQTAFAARFGLKQAIYSHYETGRKKPSLEVLMQMALVLGVSTDYLLGLSDEPPNLRDSAPPREAIKTGPIKTGNNSPVIFGDNIAPPKSTSTSRSTPRKSKPRK